MSVNKAILLGNLGQDPELVTSESGIKICNFTVATTEVIKEKKTTTWHRITAFSKAAETISKYFKKGDSIYLEGRIDNYSFDKEDGTKGYGSKIIVNTFSFTGGSKTKTEENNSIEQRAEQPNLDNSAKNDNDDLPF